MIIFFVRKKLYFMDWWLALEVYFCYRLSHACHAHSVLFLPTQFAQRFQTLSCLPCAFCFVPAYAQFAQRFQTLSCLPCALWFVPAYMHSLLKGFRLSHACHAHSVLFLPMQSLLTGF